VIFVTPRIIRNYIGNVDISEKTEETTSVAAPELKPVDQVDDAPVVSGETPDAPVPENSHDDSWNQ
jgi:type IV pilus assembly protein PilQ